MFFVQIPVLLTWGEKLTFCKDGFLFPQVQVHISLCRFKFFLQGQVQIYSAQVQIFIQGLCRFRYFSGFRLEYFSRVRFRLTRPRFGFLFRVYVGSDISPVSGQNISPGLGLYLLGPGLVFYPGFMQVQTFLQFQARIFLQGSGPDDLLGLGSDNLLGLGSDNAMSRFVQNSRSRFKYRYFSRPRFGYFSKSQLGCFSRFRFR